MSRRSPFSVDALRELWRLASQFVTADPRRLFGQDGAALRLCDIPDDIAGAILEVQFDKDGRLPGGVLVDKVRAGELRTKLAEVTEAQGFRVERGAQGLLLPAGGVSAYALGQWVVIEESRTA